ncbi:signal peptidase II [Kribbella sandramycini]|uniref:signal peptidase II n=1 Tax=Kribbella sandramycini TaxID=60450 RepID=UPI0031DFE816
MQRTRRTPLTDDTPAPTPEPADHPSAGSPSSPSTPTNPAPSTATPAPATSTTGKPVDPTTGDAAGSTSDGASPATTGSTPADGPAATRAVDADEAGAAGPSGDAGSAADGASPAAGEPATPTTGESVDPATGHAVDPTTGGAASDTSSSSSGEVAGGGEPGAGGGVRWKWVGVFGVVGLVVWGIDQVTKALALAHLTPGESVNVVGELLKFTLIRNSGAAFSLGAGYTPYISAVQIAVAIGVVVLSRKLGSAGWAVAFGLLFGGAVGNITDRIFREPSPFHGHVIDFLQTPNWAIFNVADIAVSSAAILLVIQTLRGIRLDGTREIRK